MDSAKKRIIFVNRFFYPDISATSQVLSELVFELAKQGWKIVIVTGSSSYQQPNHNFRNHEVFNDIEIFRVAKSRFSRLNYFGRFIDLCWFNLKVSIKLIYFVDKSDILVCKTDPPLLIVLGALVKASKKCKLISWNQDLFPEIAKSLFLNFPKLQLYSLLIRIRNWALRRCDQSIVISQEMAVNFESLSVSNSQVIPNWGKNLKVDQVKVDRLRDDWKLSNKFIICYSGNFGFAHEYQTVKEIIDRSRDYQNLVFLFIGSGRNFNELEQYIQFNNISNVLFRPYQPLDMLAESLSLADLHLITLKPEMEGLVFPSKFYSVCAVSRPIIFIGKTPGEMSTMIKQADCGVCFNTGESEMIAQYLANIQFDRARINQMGSNARKLFEEKYTLKQAVINWTRILSQH